MLNLFIKMMDALPFSQEFNMLFVLRAVILPVWISAFRNHITLLLVLCLIRAFSQRH